MMEALVWEAPRQMVLRQQVVPEPEPTEVQIRVAFAGICGSELSGYLGQSSLRVPPLVMGHEFSGEISAVGAEVTGLQVGQAVTVNPLIACRTCTYCQQGMGQLCIQRRLLGAHLPGGYAEYITVPAKAVLPLPAGMTLRIGALTEPAAVAVRIGALAGEDALETCLIVGAGPIGLLAAQAILHRGARQVWVAELDTDRRAMAASHGVTVLDPAQEDVIAVVQQATDGLGVAVAVDAVGTAQTRAVCIRATRTQGRVVLSGLHQETSELPVSEVVRREITLRGAFGYTTEDFTHALRLLADGHMGLDPWIVDAPLAEGGQWFDRLLDGPGPVAKVLLIP